jgi:hypothetical protein
MDEVSNNPQKEPLMKFSRNFLGLAVLLSFVSCSTTHKPVEVAQIPAVEVAPDEAFNRLPAAECDNSKYKSCKQARKNDTADRYMLAHNGTLFRRINSAVCAITDGVEDFKISQHPNDNAVIYYRKNGDLYMVNKDLEVKPQGQCPSAKGNTKPLMLGVTKYTVTSNLNTTIVNSALDRTGTFHAWDNSKVVYRDVGVEEFTMNECFGSKGKAFNSYVLFTRDSGNYVTKVKVSNGTFVKDASSTSQNRFYSISSFQENQGVCK